MMDGTTTAAAPKNLTVWEEFKRMHHPRAAFIATKEDAQRRFGKAVIRTEARIEPERSLHHGLAHAAKDLLLLTIHRCFDRLWQVTHRKTPCQQPREPLAALRLETPEGVAAVLSPDEFASALRLVDVRGMLIDIRTMRVTAVTPSSEPARDGAISQAGAEMPLFVTFARNMLKRFDIKIDTVLPYYLLASSSYLYTPQAGVALSLFDSRLSDPELNAEVISFMRRSDSLLFQPAVEDEKSARWKQKFGDEWVQLIAQLGVNLPNDCRRLPSTVVGFAPAPAAPAVSVTPEGPPPGAPVDLPPPPQRPQPQPPATAVAATAPAPAPVPANGGGSSAKAKKKKTASKSSEEVDGGEEGDEEEEEAPEDPKKPVASAAVATTATSDKPAAAEEEGGEEEEEEEGADKKPEQVQKAGARMSKTAGHAWHLRMDRAQHAHHMHRDGYGGMQQRMGARLDEAQSDELWLETLSSTDAAINSYGALSWFVRDNPEAFNDWRVRKMEEVRARIAGRSDGNQQSGQVASMDENVPIGNELLSVAQIEARHRRHRTRHRKHHHHNGHKPWERHHWMHDFAATYGIDPKLDQDYLMRLMLIRAYAPKEVDMDLLVRLYFEHADEVVRTVSRPGQNTAYLTPARDPAEWHKFLSYFDALDEAPRDGLSIGDVDRFNSIVNATLPVSQVAEAPSVRIKRYLTAYAGSKWDVLWEYAWGPLSVQTRAAIAAYLARNPSVPLGTLQRITYLVPHPAN